MLNPKLRFFLCTSYEQRLSIYVNASIEVKHNRALPLLYPHRVKGLMNFFLFRNMSFFAIVHTSSFLLSLTFSTKCLPHVDAEQILTNNTCQLYLHTSCCFTHHSKGIVMTAVYLQLSMAALDSSDSRFNISPRSAEVTLQTSTA